MVCPDCKGKKWIKCPKCGNGWKIEGKKFFTVTQCLYCFGEKFIDCPTCEGKGEITKKK